MKVKCFACALVAGMAMSAVAAADPGTQQASGVVIVDQGELRSAEVIALPKGVVPGRATYHMATRQMVIESYPAGGYAAPSLRGPTQNLLWSSIDPTGFYTNRLAASGGAIAETFDWGVVCGDPLVDTHTITQFAFSYATADPDVPVPTPYAVDIFVYWNFDPLCAADPDGTVAGFNCIAADGQGFQIVDLPGQTAQGNTWIITIDLTGGFEFTIPAGEFGYSLSNWVGFTNAGPTITAENQIAAPGTDNAFDYYPAAPQAQPIIGTFWFGGTPYAQFYFELYSLTSVCDATDLGACCLADLSCVVATAGDCAGQGGTFTTVGEACSGPFHCYPAPANDDCLAAQVITGFGQFAYDNRGATTGTEGAPSCGPQGEDVWFSWEAPCTGSVTVSTCLLNLGDDLISVYQGNDCGNLATEAACDDDGCGVVGGQSTATFNVTAGTDYLIRAGTWNGTVGAENLIEIIQGGDCTGGPMFCDADWCQDGSVGVPDIFCFLSDWFANVPEARNYGGTPGVPAIFAFLSIWFSTGQGPCTP